jgi:ribosomal protein S18 acetylase RimI-like enzyme
LPHEIRLLHAGDVALLGNVAGDVFDEAVNPAWAAEFLADPRHHLCVAIADGTVIGFASAVHYIHPDKPPQLWINEVGVAPTHQRSGIGKAIIAHLLAHGRTLGCSEAWVLTEADNVAARALYRAVGASESTCVMASFPLSPLCET